MCVYIVYFINHKFGSKIVVLVIWSLILLQLKIALGKTLNPKVAPKQTSALVCLGTSFCNFCLHSKNTL